MGVSFSANPAALGIVLGAFLVGVGIFQVPAGFAAIRYGARRVSLTGIVVLGASDALCFLAPNWQSLAAIRFVAGVGAAFFFSPALSLIASYFPAGRRGPVIGFYNGGFSIGGAIGLFGGAYVGTLWGWGATMTIGGLGLIASAVLAAFVLPREADETSVRSLSELWRRGRPVLFSRSIWALSVGLTGFWGALYIVAQYFVKFGNDVHPEWGVGVAAAVSAAVVIVSFPGGPVGGWLAERGRDRRLLAGLFAGAAGALVFLIPFLALPPLVVAMVLLGFADGVVFAILYLIPSYLPESRGDGLALGVGVINSIQVILGGAIAVAFGFVVTRWGYATAWEFAGALAVVLLPLLVLVPETRGATATSGGAGSPAPRSTD